MEAAGIEPSAEIVVSDDKASSCHLFMGGRGVKTVHGDGIDCPSQATTDPTLHWVARHWDQLPGLVFKMLRQIA